MEEKVTKRTKKQDEVAWLLDRDITKMRVTPLQEKFVEAWFKCKEDHRCTSHEMGWIESYKQTYRMLRSKSVQWLIAQRKRRISELRALEAQDFNISKSAKMELLWEIAKAGTERGFDKQGNSVMLNPQSSIQAVAQLNQMQGHNAPTEVDVRVHDETRSEKEIVAHIQELRAEMDDLLSLSYTKSRAQQREEIIDAEYEELLKK